MFNAQVDSRMGDRRPTLEDIKALYFTMRCLLDLAFQNGIRSPLHRWTA